MNTLLQRFGDNVKGYISGFVRLVFKGMLRPIMFAAGAQVFLATHGVLNKDYKEWMISQSTAQYRLWMNTLRPLAAKG